ncbi:AAA family ATPase [Nitratifractor sp.]
MEILEYFQSLKPRPSVFRPRKLSLPEHGSFFLYGARGTGKTTLLLEHLHALDQSEWLYLDAQDPAFALEDIDTDLLEDFLSEESIETLAIDHWYPDFLERLPRCDRLILVGREAPATDLLLSAYELFPLDYEEFLGFDRSHSPTLAFNRFLKLGTLPAMALSEPEAAPLRLRELFYEAFNDAESRLLLILARFQGRRVSAHQIYTTAREYFRISKDWTYAALKRFEAEKLLFLIPEIGGGSGKKLILYDFVLTRYLNKRQPFPATFDAMIALALLKHGFPFHSAGPLGYRIDESRELILPSPFENEEQFWHRAQKQYSRFQKLDVAKVSIVTVSNRFRFRIGSIDFEALPFYEWSILNE